MYKLTQEQLAYMRPEDKSFVQRWRNLNIQAIAFGNGPSFYSWIGRPVPNVKTFGCSIGPVYRKFDYYCYGDIVHKDSMLLALEQGTIVYSSKRNIVDHPLRMILFDEDILPTGCSSGGMALSLACYMYDVVGLVGYDGYTDPQANHDLGVVIDCWQKRGKQLISLMPQSVHNFEDTTDVFPSKDYKLAESNDPRYFH